MSSWLNIRLIRTSNIFLTSHCLELWKYERDTRVFAKSFSDKNVYRTAVIRLRWFPDIKEEIWFSYKRLCTNVLGSWNTCINNIFMCRQRSEKECLYLVPLTDQHSISRPSTQCRALLVVWLLSIGRQVKLPSWLQIDLLFQTQANQRITSNSSFFFSFFFLSSHPNILNYNTGLTLLLIASAYLTPRWGRARFDLTVVCRFPSAHCARSRQGPVLSSRPKSDSRRQGTS